MKAFVTTRFVDVDGAHEVGEEIDLPRETAEEKVAFQTLIDYKIISTRRSDADQPQDYGQPAG